ncbi:MAG TPA: hypothetical protein V6C63_17425, partial [Allocoleopsis sp.]
ENVFANFEFVKFVKVVLELPKEQRDQLFDVALLLKQQEELRDAANKGSLTPRQAKLLCRVEPVVKSCLDLIRELDEFTDNEF